jgi:hypothetical protein
MAYRLQDLPLLQNRRGRCAAATAFALAVAGAWQPALLPGQIEVEMLTSGTKAAAGATTAPAAAEATPASGSATDYTADQSAQKIVPAPGTVLQSTQDSSLGRTEAIAPAPSLQLNNDQLILKEGETTETVAVKSGAELLRMLGIQKKEVKPAAELEMTEDTSNTLFDVSAIERLKGSKPTVVYRVVVENTPLPDPMIVPWIRQAKLLQERFDKAVAMLGNNQVEQGRQELLAIATDFPDSDYAVQSLGLLKKLEDINRTEMPKPVIQEDKATVTVELSPNIQVGTVIVDPADPTGNRVMINGHTYKVGDEIKGVTGHHLVGISENVVKIEVEQSGLKQTFDVPVRRNGMNNL